jgi:hypothetical protein
MREYFEIKRSKKGWSVKHIPSGDRYQQHLCDFPTRISAEKLLNRLSLVEGVDWASAAGQAGMSTALHERVWAAVYAD